MQIEHVLHAGHAIHHSAAFQEDALFCLSTGKSPGWASSELAAGDAAMLPVVGQLAAERPICLAGVDLIEPTVRTHRARESVAFSSDGEHRSAAIETTVDHIW